MEPVSAPGLPRRPATTLLLLSLLVGLLLTSFVQDSALLGGVAASGAVSFMPSLRSAYEGGAASAGRAMASVGGCAADGSSESSPSPAGTFFDESLMLRYAQDFAAYGKVQRQNRNDLKGRVRHHSYPLVTGDGFRSLADVVLQDPGQMADAEWCSRLGRRRTAVEAAGAQESDSTPRVKYDKGEALILFVEVGLVDHFFQKCFPSIAVPIVLVTHNGDDAVPGPASAWAALNASLAKASEAGTLAAPISAHAAAIDALFPLPAREGGPSAWARPRSGAPPDSLRGGTFLRHWFGQNVEHAHPLLTAIPIGLENRMWGPGQSGGFHGSVPEIILFNAVTSAVESPAGKVIEAPGQHTWAWFDRGTHPPVRDPLWNQIVHAIEKNGVSWMRLAGPRLQPWEFYPLVTRHAAMVCPRGNGLDTHRAWETLYLGRVPILLTGALNPMWEGLPALILEDWSDLMSSEERIVEAVRDFSKRAGTFNAHKLFMPWWACLIGKAAGREAEFCTGKDGILAVLDEAGRDWADDRGREALKRLEERGMGRPPPARAE